MAREKRDKVGVANAIGGFQSRSPQDGGEGQRQASVDNQRVSRGTRDGNRWGTGKGKKRRPLKVVWRRKRQEVKNRDPYHGENVVRKGKKQTLRGGHPLFKINIRQ